ncbi:MAG: hypothetical protein ACSLEY_03600 [Candidatus Saccharimonadales bacterium]
MKDLDFDELDKAVNSLMSANGKKSDDGTVAVPDAPEVATAEVVTVQQVAEETPIVSGETQISAPEAEAAAEKPTPVVKRRGQFMDVVHPSSDMLATNKTSSITGRVGVSIAPPTTPIETANPEPVEETSVAPIETIEETYTPTTDMPDPIDVHESIMTEKVEPAPIIEEVIESVPVISEEPAISGSPFLDTQVEKRPLGAAAPTGSTPAGPEMQVDAPALSTTEVAPEPVDPEVSVNPIVTNVEPIREQPIPPSAIAQQYKEQESTGDKDHATIYDTIAVNVPLIHPAKERSGWLWVIWTLLLVVVGALGAATLWYFKII